MQERHFIQLTSLLPGFYLVVFAVFLSGCKQPEEVSEDVVARVYDAVLLRSELREKMPENLSGEDSARFADQIITNWIRSKAVLRLAENNLSEERKDFTEELNEYRNTLVTYAYERELVNQKLDTVVSEDEIASFYENNIENFKLRNYILRLKFVKINEAAPNQDKLEAWFLSDKAAAREKLDEYCRKYADNYYLFEDTWLYLEDVLREIPLVQTDWDNFLRQNTYYKFQEGKYIYLIRIIDYKLRGDTSPLSLERKTIKDLIVNKRKVALIQKMREDAVNEAYADNKIEWKK